MGTQASWRFEPLALSPAAAAVNAGGDAERRLSQEAGHGKLTDDADGPAGRFLCVALSRDGITNWSKPELDLVPFYDNATGVNHTRTNILNTRRSGTTFIDSNPRAPASQRFKTIIPGGTVYASADGFRWEVLTQGHIPYSDTQPVAFFDNTLGK